MTFTTLTDNDYKEMILSHIERYDSIEDFMRTKYYGMKNTTKEECLEEFEDTMKSGFIHNITCGTYNGATDTFDPWELTDDNIVEMIFNEMHESDFYNGYGYIFLEDEDGNETVEALEQWSNFEQWSNLRWTYEFSELFNILVIGKEVFVDKD